MGGAVTSTEVCTPFDDYGQSISAINLVPQDWTLRKDLGRSSEVREERGLV